MNQLEAIYFVKRMKKESGKGQSLAHLLRIRGVKKIVRVVQQDRNLITDLEQKRRFGMCRKGAGEVHLISVCASVQDQSRRYFLCVIFYYMSFDLAVASREEEIINSTNWCRKDSSVAIESSR